MPKGLCEIGHFLNLALTPTTTFKTMIKTAMLESWDIPHEERKMMWLSIFWSKTPIAPNIC